MSRTSIIGLYSHAHSGSKMKGRIEAAIKTLNNRIDYEFVGSINDHDKKGENHIKNELSKKVNDSSSILLILAGWVESTTTIRILSGFSHKPVIVWTLAGYYKKGELVAPAGAAAASLLKPTLENLGYKYKIIYQKVGEELKADEIKKEVLFFDNISKLGNSKLASIGYACSDLYPFMYDGNSIKKFFGVHVDNIDLLEIKKLADEVSNHKINSFVNNFLKKICLKINHDNNELNSMARYVIVLKKIIKENNYKGITIKCGSGPGKLLNFTPCMILSCIAEEVEAICECDIHNLLLQIIIKQLTGLKTTFLEVFEYFDSTVLMASCGYAPFEMCADNCISVFNHSWDNSGGLMNISELKTGLITVSQLYNKNGEYYIFSTIGQGKRPEKFQEEGWENENGPKIPGLEISLDLELDKFQNNIYNPHFIISYGDNTKILKEYCKYNRINFIEKV